MIKRIEKVVVLGALSVAICCNLHAQKKEDKIKPAPAKPPKKSKVEKKSEQDRNEIKLPNGRILKNPYIISRTPAGLNIGHEKGVAFVPFTSMTKAQQKKYNYNPKKAKAYLKRRAKAQKNRQKRLAKQAAEARKYQESRQDSFDYGDFNDFPQLTPLQHLQKELRELVAERKRLERQRTIVSRGGVLPGNISSERYDVTFRGGKVYRRVKPNYGGKAEMNEVQKKRRLREINNALQQNSRRTTNVRNLISKAKGKGIKVGRAVYR